jgi:hypothetical protein
MLVGSLHPFADAVGFVALAARGGDRAPTRGALAARAALRSSNGLRCCRALLRPAPELPRIAITPAEYDLAGSDTAGVVPAGGDRGQHAVRPRHGRGRRPHAAARLVTSLTAEVVPPAMRDTAPADATRVEGSGLEGAERESARDRHRRSLLPRARRAVAELTDLVPSPTVSGAGRRDRAGVELSSRNLRRGEGDDRRRSAVRRPDRTRPISGTY